MTHYTKERSFGERSFLVKPTSTAKQSFLTDDKKVVNQILKTQFV